MQATFAGWNSSVSLRGARAKALQELAASFDKWESKSLNATGIEADAARVGHSASAVTYWATRFGAQRTAFNDALVTQLRALESKVYRDDQLDSKSFLSSRGVAYDAAKRFLQNFSDSVWQEFNSEEQKVSDARTSTKEAMAQAMLKKSDQGMRGFAGEDAALRTAAARTEKRKAAFHAHITRRIAQLLRNIDEVEALKPTGRESVPQSLYLMFAEVFGIKRPDRASLAELVFPAKLTLGYRQE